ncbi:MAG: hypothetical protein M8467_12730 [Anaerolineae bacterium]|nr:hypothetical protein [Anaerolineae bacterium]
MLACALLLSGVALSAGDAASVDWYVIGAGGAAEAAAGTLVMGGTAGQAVAGVARQSLCAGFWCGAGRSAGYSTYLPLIVR